VSVEIIPPRRGGNLERVYEAMSSLMPFEPPFIDITSPAAATVWDEVPGGTYRRRVTRRPPARSACVPRSRTASTSTGAVRAL
jgi:methylenetetrahydrofolate reductase (NADPH)